MDFFSDHAVLFALVCSAVAIAYGIGLTYWLLRQPAGSERMQEIARAVQEGGAAQGVTHITAGNYGGNLGPHHFHLKEIIA